jgi:dihydrofolate reductase
MLFNLIVAVCKNNGIGYKGEIPWRIKADLQYFSKLTKGTGRNAVIMGCNTWKSLPQGGVGLKGRDNLVLSKASQSFDIFIDHEQTIKTFTCFDHVERFISHQSYNGNWIIGGAQIYQHYLSTNQIKRCYITYIDKDFECDTFFPDLDMTQWTEVERRSEYDSKYACAVDYVVYEKL